MFCLFSFLFSFLKLETNQIRPLWTSDRQQFTSTRMLLPKMFNLILWLSKQGILCSFQLTKMLALVIQAMHILSVKNLLMPVLASVGSP